MTRPKKVKKEESVELVKDLTDNKPIQHKDDDILLCECTKVFFDKYTDKLYELGKKYKFTYKRIKEIKAKNEKYLKVLDK